MKTIDEYAIELVTAGARTWAEDDNNWANDIAVEDHDAACDLAQRLATAIDAQPQIVLALVAAEDLAKLRAALGVALDTMDRLRVEHESKGLYQAALAYTGAAELVRQALRGGDE